MTLQEVIDNLTRTIEGKITLRDALVTGNANENVIKFVQINIDELERIKQDLLKIK